MRKHLLAVLLSFGGLTGHAQTTLSKGTWQLDGNVSYNRVYGENVGGSYSSNQTTSSFSINPGVGYLVADNLALGLSGSYSSTNYDGLSGSGSSTYQRSTRGFSVGPFADFYRIFTSYFGLKGRVSTYYSHGSDDYSQNNQNNLTFSTSTYNGVGGSVVPSLMFFPVPRLAVGASLGGLYFNRNWSKTPDAVNGDGQGYNVGVNFGLSYLALSGTFYPGRH